MMKTEKRLIDANEAIEKINCLCVDGNENWIGTDSQSFVDHADVIEILADATTVDAKPVVHGRWENGDWTGEVSCYYINSRFGNKSHLCEHTPLNCHVCEMNEARYKTLKKCPVCGHQQRNETNYCPNCGAQMDGDGNG